MVKYLDKKNNYDFIHQFQWIKSDNKPSLKSVLIDTNNNEAVKRTSLIYSTYYSMLMLFNQRPYVKTTKNSIASFSVKPNMNLGGQLSLSKDSVFVEMMFYYLNPSLSESSMQKHVGRNKSYVYKDNKYKIQVGYGIDDLRTKLFFIHHTSIEESIGGGNLTYRLESPVKFIPFYYLQHS